MNFYWIENIGIETKLFDEKKILFLFFTNVIHHPHIRYKQN